MRRFILLILIALFIPVVQCSIFNVQCSPPSGNCPERSFFLTHKEINVAEFARSMGMNPTLLRNYINGFKKPSKEREQEIMDLFISWARKCY